MNKFYFSLLLFCITIIKVNASDNDSTGSRIFEWSLGYICDAGRNFSGGIKSGNGYLGLISGDLTFRTDKFLKGGEFNLVLMNTHGRNLSENYVGDMQVISNIENGNYTFVEKMYYRQTFSNLYFLLGLQDLNEEFCVSEYGAAFTNSSFGIHSTFALNFASPIYPKTALAFVGIYNINDKFTIKAGICDGNPGSLDEDAHNLNWSLSTKEGFLNIGELDYKSPSEKLTSIKIGGFYHTSEFPDADADSVTENGNYGIYGICDKQVFERGTTKIGIFGQLAYFPSKVNFNTTYIGAGLNFTGLIKKRQDDCLALGFAYARLFDNKYECDVECNYALVLGSHFALQPALHYVIHPGANQGLDNAFAGFLRLTIFK